MAHAAKALVIRFWDLTKVGAGSTYTIPSTIVFLYRLQKADPLDIILILMGYLHTQHILVAH